MAPHHGLFDLTDHVILVTGASGGIGAEVARSLAAHGARVLLAGRDTDKLAALEAAIPGAQALPFDMTDPGAPQAAVDRIVDQYGRLDAVFCIAAARDRKRLHELSVDAYRVLVEANLIAPYALAQAAAPVMQAAGRGRIVMMTSLAQDFSTPLDAGYPSTKAGLAGLVRSLAVGLGAHGITVNGIAPGAIKTDVNAALAADPDWTTMINRTVPLKRWGEADELSGAAVFLASEASAYMTGQIMFIDGGASVRMFPMEDEED
ncbi:MAG: SDR family oxidoreductase [Pseudomonadota bacterium]